MMFLYLDSSALVKRYIDESHTQKKAPREAGIPEYRPAPGCADLAGDLIGAVYSGRSDLATNSRLLDAASSCTSWRT